MDVIFVQIIALPVAALSLPMPVNRRLLQITEALIGDLTDNRNLDEWACIVCASKRALTRLFTLESGLSFQAWRQQSRLHRALELLTAGQNVTRVSGEVGYGTARAFIAMFHRCFEARPSHFFEHF